MRKKHQERRNFLKASAHMALLGSGAAAVNGKMNLIGSALAAQGDYGNLPGYKALVCVFLYGGSDSFNLFIPGDDAIFNVYQDSRGPLALDPNTLLPSASGDLRFNPNLPDLKNLYDALFSHNHQQEQVQKSWSSKPTGLVGAGWGGRMADLLMEANGSNDLPTCFSVNNANFFQPGNRSLPIAINETRGPQLMTYFDQTSSSLNAGRDNVMAQLVGLSSDHAMERLLANSYISARDSSRALSSVIDASPDFGEVAPDNRLANQLRMIARMISGREQLGLNRQIFFAGLGGWDTHDNQTPRLESLSQRLNDAFAQFNRDLEVLGIQNDVTTFTTSDFGRTLTINGDGSDHGWGGHYMVMGGAVNGGQMYGDWPNYAVGGDDDIGEEGRLIPSMSLNEYGASLGSWMGLSNSDLLEVFPDLGNFDNGWQNGFGIFS